MANAYLFVILRSSSHVKHSEVLCISELLNCERVLVQIDGLQSLTIPQDFSWNFLEPAHMLHSLLYQMCFEILLCQYLAFCKRVEAKTTGTL